MHNTSSPVNQAVSVAARLSWTADLTSGSYCVGAALSSVVEISGDGMELLEDHLRLMGLGKEEIDAKISCHRNWYGVVNGNYS